MRLRRETKLHFCSRELVPCEIAPLRHTDASSVQFRARVRTQQTFSWDIWALRRSWCTVKRNWHIIGRPESKVNGERVRLTGTLRSLQRKMGERMNITCSIYTHICCFLVAYTLAYFYFVGSVMELWCNLACLCVWKQIFSVVLHLCPRC